VRTIRSCLHIMLLPYPSSKTAILKIIISPLSKSKSESFVIPFYDSPLNSAHSCIQIAITIVVVTENVCMSRRWKAELVAYRIRKQAYRIRKQPSLRIMYLTSLKPDHSPVCPVCPESVQHLILTSKSYSYQTVHQNRPYD
jgi:hypothetical protein